MNLISTNLAGGKTEPVALARVKTRCHEGFPPKALRTRRHPRGTAELETALVIPILLGILFLVGYLLQRGRAQLAGVYNAENNAYAQVVDGRGLTPASDPLPIDGINAIRPALPNRFDIASPTASVTSNAFGDVVSTRSTERAIFLDSAWHYSSWPNTVDQPQIQAWFEQYVGESHPPDLVYSLGLRPPGPP